MHVPSLRTADNPLFSAVKVTVASVHTLPSLDMVVWTLAFSDYWG